MHRRGGDGPQLDHFQPVRLDQHAGGLKGQKMFMIGGIPAPEWAQQTGLPGRSVRCQSHAETAWTQKASGFREEESGFLQMLNDMGGENEVERLLGREFLKALLPNLQSE